MRHLDPPILPKLPSAPANPPAGHLALYAGTDGHLHTRAEDGTDVALTPGGGGEPGGGGTGWTVARITADTAISSTNLVDIPGLTVDVTEPGLYELHGAARLLGPSLLVGNAALNGPAADQFNISMSAGYSDEIDNENVVVDTTLAFTRYGVPVVFRVDNSSSGETRQYVKWQGTLHLTEPGTIAIQANAVRSILTYTELANNWIGQDCYLIEDFTHVHSGSLSMLVTSEGNGVDEIHAIAFNDGYDMEEGATVRLSAWLYAPDGWPDAGIYLQWADDADSIGQSWDFGPLAAGTWEQRTITTTVPAGARYWTVRVSFAGTPGFEQQFWVDDVLFERLDGDITVRAGAFLAVRPMQ